MDLKVTATAYYTYLDTITAPKGDPFLKSELAGRTWTRGTGTRLGLDVLDPGQPSTAPAGKVSLPFADDNSDLTGSPRSRPTTPRTSRSAVPRRRRLRATPSRSMSA